MTSNYSTIEVEAEEMEYKNAKITFGTHRIYTSFISQLPFYYIVNDTFRWQVITAQ